jgi:hypothetical protein
MVLVVSIYVSLDIGLAGKTSMQLRSSINHKRWTRILNVNVLQ